MSHCEKRVRNVHLPTTAKAHGRRINTGCKAFGEAQKHAKLNNLFFEERSHQVIENKGSGPKTKP
jgi:hypothetical protein